MNGVFARGLRGQHIHSKGIKEHLSENNFGNVSGMLVKQVSNY